MINLVGGPVDGSTVPESSGDIVLVRAAGIERFYVYQLDARARRYLYLATANDVTEAADGRCRAAPPGLVGHPPGDTEGLALDDHW